MMKDIVIYGAGGFGREIACLINKLNRTKKTWNLLGFIDDGVDTGTEISHYGKVLGDRYYLNEYKSLLAVVMSIGSPKTVKEIVTFLNNSNLYYPNIISPDFEIADAASFKIGVGNVIQSHCFASCDVCIGDFNTLNGSVTLSHDNMVGSYNVFMPNVRISGDVKIGDLNLFGVGSIVLQQIKIGSEIRLGAGGVLMRKPKDGCIYIGNPAKLFKIE